MRKRSPPLGVGSRGKCKRDPRVGVPRRGENLTLRRTITFLRTGTPKMSIEFLIVVHIAFAFAFGVGYLFGSRKR